MSKIDKSLTIGVEIEMTGLARAHAADIVSTHRARAGTETNTTMIPATTASTCTP